MWYGRCFVFRLFAGLTGDTDRGRESVRKVALLCARKLRLGTGEKVWGF